MKAETFVRVLFDECISKLLVKDLADFLARRRPSENYSLGLGQAEGGVMIRKLRRLNGY